ncbi:hypothetical protein chiPu_0029980 [Chiloscyllium punctatum]|uniref:Uncharacterized protein n=1 Tax=Chiloscyllium punctatum TaxID=137246 RepID=A0A401TTH4_CHIPU|nr:hypothetical protein [Chiloscyllium punctatum]
MGEAHFPSGGTAAWQSDDAHVAVESSRTAQFDQHDVVIQVLGTIARVPDDFGRSDLLLTPFYLGDVVFPEVDPQMTGNETTNRLRERLETQGRLAFRVTPPLGAERLSHTLQQLGAAGHRDRAWNNINVNHSHRGPAQGENSVTTRARDRDTLS